MRQAKRSRKHRLRNQAAVFVAQAKIQRDRVFPFLANQGRGGKAGELSLQRVGIHYGHTNSCRYLRQYKIPSNAGLEGGGCVLLLVTCRHPSTRHVLGESLDHSFANPLFAPSTDPAARRSRLRLRPAPPPRVSSTQAGRTSSEF